VTDQEGVVEALRVQSVGDVAGQARQGHVIAVGRAAVVTQVETDGAVAIDKAPGQAPEILVRAE
jgi:hypothetical protein